MKYCRFFEKALKSRKFVLQVHASVTENYVGFKLQKALTDIFNALLPNAIFVMCSFAITIPIVLPNYLFLP